jgi:Na+-transporting NADH:ubiquinone oxidoreductase subunit NqrA
MDPGDFLGNLVRRAYRIAFQQVILIGKVRLVGGVCSVRVVGVLFRVPEKQRSELPAARVTPT